MTLFPWSEKYLVIYAEILYSFGCICESMFYA